MAAPSPDTPQKEAASIAEQEKGAEPVSEPVKGEQDTKQDTEGVNQELGDNPKCEQPLEADQKKEEGKAFKKRKMASPTAILGQALQDADSLEATSFCCPLPSCGKSFGVENNMRRHSRIHDPALNVCLAKHLEVAPLLKMAPPRTYTALPLRPAQNLLNPAQVSPVTPASSELIH